MNGGRAPVPPIALPDPATATVRSGREPSATPRRAPTADDLAAIAAACPTASDRADRAEHGRDWWPLAIAWALDNDVVAMPAAVCRPTETRHVAALLAECSRRSIPVTCSGGRSSVTGAAVAPHDGIALDMCAMSGVSVVDATSGLVEVLAGTFGPDLEDHLRAHGLSVGHFPQSFEISTVGGWIASRGAGQYSTRHGKIEDLVAGLEVVLADGTVLRTGGAPAAAAGPDLTQLFVGSEGALGVVTRAWLRAHASPGHRAVSAWRLGGFADGVEACRRILRRGATPAVLRLYDEKESARSHGGNGTESTLLVLDEADEAIVGATMAIVEEVLGEVGARRDDDGLVARWLEHRNDTSALQALIGRGYVVDTMEVAGNWSVLGGVHERVVAEVGSVEGVISVSCHLSHSYPDGACLYFSFAGRPADPAGYDDLYRAMWDAGQGAALDAGANLSHHHGIGRNRARFAPRALGAQHGVISRIKDSLDPAGILNPGVMGL